MLQSISSAQTFVAKYIFGPIWLGGFAAATWARGLLPESMRPGPIVPAGFSWLFLLIWLGASYVLWRGCIGLKRVRIDGDTLLISNYWKEIEVPVREVAAVRGSEWRNGRVTVTFEHDTAFGKSITFIPETQIRFFDVWGPHPVVGAILGAARQARESPHR